MTPTTFRQNSGAQLALALATALGALGTSIANIALPSLAAGFAAPYAAVQLVVVAYLAAVTAVVVIAGRLGDVYGLKPMLLLGLGLYGGASALCGAAPSLGFLIGARALQGVGAAFLLTLSLALMRQTASEERLGRALGWLGSASACGTALGPALGGVVIASWGWRGVFWAQVPLAALVLALVLSSPAGARAAGAPPPLRRALTRHLAPHLLVNACVSAVMMTTLVVGPFYLGRGVGLSETAVGMVLAIGPMASILSGAPMGRLVDAWGGARAVRLGLGLLALGAGMLAILPVWLGLAGYIAGILALTPGYQLFQAANNAVALASAPPKQRGAISGLLTLSRNLGLIAGASGLSALFFWGLGAAPDGAGLTEGLRRTFLCAGVMMLAAGALLRRRSEEAPQGKKPEIQEP